MTIPLLPAWENGPGQWAVWCPRCGCLHYHGPLPGTRSPHCLLPGGPSYYLVPTGKPLPADAKRLDSRGRRRVERILSGLKVSRPAPDPAWAQPLGRDTALALLAAYEYRHGRRGQAFADAMQQWEDSIAPMGGEI